MMVLRTLYTAMIMSRRTFTARIGTRTFGSRTGEGIINENAKQRDDCPTPTLLVAGSRRVLVRYVQSYSMATVRAASSPALDDRIGPPVALCPIRLDRSDHDTPTMPYAEFRIAPATRTTGLCGLPAAALVPASIRRLWHSA
jgi:hypothetical protein